MNLLVFLIYIKYYVKLAPYDKKIKCVGKTKYEKDRILKEFGILFDEIDCIDKLMMMSLILDSYYLETKEKSIAFN